MTEPVWSIIIALVAALAIFARWLIVDWKKHVPAEKVAGSIAKEASLHKKET